MIAFAQQLSPAMFDDLLAEITGMDPKTALGWIKMIRYFKRFGSIAADDRSVSGVLGVTVKHMFERSWPMIATRLERTPDGKRYVCPGVQQGDTSRRAAAAPDATKIPSQRHQRAANIRHHGNVWGAGRGPSLVTVDASPSHPDASETDASMHDDACKGDAKTPASSTDDASVLHADAPSASHADSLSPSTSFSESSDQQSEGEGESRDASADASSDAKADAPDAPDASVGHATPRAASAPDSSTRKKPKSYPLPDDWVPPAAVTALIVAAGRDPAPIAAHFRSHYKGIGTKKADWDASFESWWYREPVFDPTGARKQQQQSSMVMAIPGGKPAEAAEQLDDGEDEACAGTDEAAQFARVRRAMRQAVGSEEYRQWLSSLVLLRVEGDEVVLGLRSSFLRDRARQEHRERLLDLWQAENDRIRDIEFDVTPAAAASA